MLAQQCIGVENVGPVGFKQAEPAFEVGLCLILLSLLVAVDKEIEKVLSIGVLVS